MRVKRVCISSRARPRGTGWLPSLPDLRDYTNRTPAVVTCSKKLGLSRSLKKSDLPSSCDLRTWCSPVEDQGEIGSCTAHACMSIVEYYQRRAFGKHLDGSKLYLYKTTRNLMGEVGDSGADLRNAMGALALCGVPPERLWPYTDLVPDFDREPTPFVYAVADNYEAMVCELRPERC